jgi:hypothetical protein
MIPFLRKPVRRSALLHLERISVGKLRRQLRKLRLQAGVDALFAAYLRRIQIRGRGPRLLVPCRSPLCTRKHHRPIVEAALLRFELLNPHLFPRRRQIQPAVEGSA